MRRRARPHARTRVCSACLRCLPRAWFVDVGALRGNVGARTLLRGRADEVVAIEAPELARDIDTPEDLARVRALNR